MSNTYTHPICKLSGRALRAVRLLIGFLLWTYLLYVSPSVAQVPPPITSSGLNTTITQNGNAYNITGGTRPGNGPNLFHSFGEFGVPTNNIANFLNETPNLATSNILGRVTGGNPSNVFGSITTTDFGNANLFLINPAGIVFGPNATLNVRGSVTFTMANTIRLADAGIFHADTASASVLTSAPVEAFGFLGTNSGAITVQGSNLSVEPGHAINLVGGDIVIAPAEVAPDTVQPAHIAAAGGQINLVSVAAVGEVLASSFQPTSGMTLGSINLGPGTLIDVSGNAAGTVRIRSGQLVMDNAVISADTVNANGAPVAIDINATDSIAISTVDGPALSARTSGSGDAGEVRVSSGTIDVTATGADSFLFTIIDTHTSGAGKAGNVTISADNLSVAGDPTGITTFFIDSGTTGTDAGHGGDITITARDVHLQDTYLGTGSAVSDQLGETATGSAGNVSISADNLELSFAGAVTDALGFETESGRGGDISVSAGKITMESSFLSSFGIERGGTVAIHADQVVASDSTISTETSRTAGGTLTISGGIIELSNGSGLISSTAGDGNAGNITVIATDHVGLLRTNPTDRPSGIFSNSFGTLGSLGSSGDIVIQTPRLEMTGGSRINTSTATSGRGGNVTINTSDSITMSGEAKGFSPDPLFSLGVILNSGLFTRSIGGHCSGLCGNAGNISINTGSLAMGTGSQINSGTSSNGQGGIIAINAGNTISISGTLSTGQPGGIQSRTIGTEPDAGSGGNISLTAGQSVTISDGAAVTASSTGPGNAGNIAINAGQVFDMRNSSVKTEAAQASGGNIDIQAIDRVRLVNSSISTSVLGGSGSGGNITIDPNVVILQNSQIIAQAVQGAGGNISIVTPLFLADASSLVDASSQFGLSGTVNIQSPTSNLAGTVSSLPSSLRQVQSLQTGRCAALADSRSSSLIVAGRDNLPAEPGGWSPSPFTLMGEETDSFAMASPPVAAMTASADAPVSLRRLTPAGFLTQSFAENGLTGCRV